LRQIAPNDRDVETLCNAVEEIIEAGGFVRHGGGENTRPKVTPASLEWKKEPPENP
jgi:hypothetical protein